MKIRIGVLLAAVVLASFAVVYDRMTVNLDFPAPPVQGHKVEVTTTLTPHLGGTSDRP
jgi:hypothetical protein